MVNITTSQRDNMDETLKVMFLLLSLTIYTNSFSDGVKVISTVLGPTQILRLFTLGRPWLNSGEVHAL